MTVGDKVVVVLSGAGVETATIQTITKVAKEGIRVSELEHAVFDSRTLRAKENVIAGFHNRLIVLDE